MTVHAQYLKVKCNSLLQKLYILVTSFHPCTIVHDIFFKDCIKDGVVHLTC